MRYWVQMSAFPWLMVNLSHFCKESVTYCSAHLLFSIVVPYFLSRWHFRILSPSTFPWSLRISGTQGWGMSQTVGQWGLGMLWVCVHQSIISNPDSGSSCRLSWVNTPEKASSVLFYSSCNFTMSSLSFLLCSQKFSYNVLPKPLHGHSAALVCKVSTPCLGNYAAGDRHQLAEGIINIINHWNFY